MSSRAKKSIIWIDFAPNFCHSDYWALFKPSHSMRKEDGAVFLETVHSAECIFFMDLSQPAYSSVLDSLVWLGPPLFYFLYSEAFSDLSFVFCNAIHSHNLENELFTLKVGCVIMSLNPSTTLRTAHVQVLMSDSLHWEII